MMPVTRDSERVRVRPQSARYAGILTAILLILAASLGPVGVRAASPSPAPSPAIKVQPGTGGSPGSRSPSQRASVVAPLEGLDVSRWQATISWPQVKAAGKQFVVMKATQGTAYVDPMYTTNRAGAMAVGIPMAAYHFADPDSTPGEAVAEADHYVAVAGLTPGNLLPALDLEQTGALSPAALQVWVRAWLDEVTAKLGIQPMIYVSPSFWSTKMANNTSIALAGYKVLWIANWGVTSPTVPANGWSGNGWTFWQYTDCGHVAGITTGCVDLDRFAGTDLTPVTYHPNFAVVANPTGQSVTRGATTTFTINVNRTQFVPPVTLSVASAMPSGTTAVFSPNPVTGSTSTLTITTSNVPTVTPPGIVSPTIQGVGGGLTRTTLAKLTVLPAIPDAPTGVVATPLDASAYVTWLPPANDGGGTIGSYAVTAAPGGRTCSTKTGLFCTVSGLTNGTAYTFTTVATNESGPGATSAASAAVTPVVSIPGATYFALSPSRLVDTRAKKGLTHGALKAGVASTFQVTGVGANPVPADAVAVTGNLTVTGQTAAGYFALTSVATNKPRYSTLNFPLGDTRANGVTIPLGSGGKLGLVYMAHSGSSAQAIFDVTGYYLPGASGASYFPLASTRLVDSRSKTGLTGGAVKAGTPGTFQVTGLKGIPAEAVAVTGNLTVTDQTAAGYLALTSVATAKPTTSTINFPLGDTRANGVTIALGAGGKLSVTYMARRGASAQVLFDVTGYFLPGSTGATWFAVDPSRLVDTRSKLGLTGGAVKAGTPTSFGATGQATNPAFNVPIAAIAVTGNLTVTGQTAAGYLALTSVSTTKPGTSTINFPLGDTRANGLTAALGTGGKLWVIYVARKGASAQVLFDVTGYFLAGS
jgi:GH25 family lysozyme M1 (1,4-beta-N-acetylmuramidase)